MHHIKNESEEQMKSYVLHLIRHMPSEGNLQGRYIGRTESPVPMEEITRLVNYKRKYIYPEKVKTFYASPSTRCVDTLKVLYPEAEPEVILEMAECDFGDFENRTAEELKENPEFTQWLENSGQAAPPNGESGSVFAARVLRGFEMLVQNLVRGSRGEAVLVTHVGVMMTLLSVYGLPRAGYHDWLCEPGCGYSDRLMPSLWMRSQVVEVFAQVPFTGGAGTPREHTILDLAREAAERAYGEAPEK